MSRGMSPKLIPLQLPQLVEERKKHDSSSHLSSPDSNSSPGPWPSYAFPTTNSSCSDIPSPVTPTFSPRAHARISSSSSSLDLPPLPPSQDGYASPSLLSTTLTKSSLRQLPDVEEEPLERDHYDDDVDDLSDEDNFELSSYSCLYNDACPQSNSTEDFFASGLVGDCDINDYDVGFFSDGDLNTASTYPKKKRAGMDSHLSGLTARFESCFPTIRRWRSGRRSRMLSAGPIDYSLDNVLSHAPSSRSSSISALARPNPDIMADAAIPPTPPLPFSSTDSINIPSLTQTVTNQDKLNIERDRATAITPLLPLTMTSALGRPPRPESPLQSPTIEAVPSPPMLSSAAQSPSLKSAPFARPPLSSRPSTQSMRNLSGNIDPSLSLSTPLPSIMQERDEWSDRLGHANFIITPAPYELSSISPESITKFHNDWDAARSNYTKHLVRIGENYGQTSNIYALTEDKWAETERRWRAIYQGIIKQTMPPTAAQNNSDSRSRSRGRGRGRGRSVSAHPASVRQSPQGDGFAGTEWKRLEDHIPTAVPQMLEALDAAQGKFPSRGDEDIVGPMHREAYMAGAHTEDSRSRFWKSLAGKVGIHR